MVCCTTLWWDGAGKGRGWKTAAIIYCWQRQQHVRGRHSAVGYLKWGHPVADLDSGALALTKEASGNSRVNQERPIFTYLWNPGPSLPHWWHQRRRHCHIAPCQWSAPSQSSFHAHPPSDPALPWRGWCSSLAASTGYPLDAGGSPQAGAVWER